MNAPPEHRNAHRLEAPSAWVTRWAAVVPEGCTVLDVACGSGRHAKYFAERGYAVEAVDRDAAALAGLAGLRNVTVRCTDLETGFWPYAGRKFGVIVVTNYLHRPLFTHLLESVDENGVLIYETFALGNERFGRPSNPDFLLNPGELLERVRENFRVIAYEDVCVDEPRPAALQRICARRQS